MIHPLQNKILFTFLNETDSKGLFKDKTSFGFEIIGNTDDTTKIARWAKVLAFGPKATSMKNGLYILVEPLMYTNGFVHDNIRIWQTDESKVMLVSEEKPDISY